MFKSAATILSDIRDRFDLGRQTTRHTDASLISKFNSIAHSCRSQLYAMGCVNGLTTLISASGSAVSDGTSYNGDRVDTFGVGGYPVYAERIHSVEWVPTTGSPVTLQEIALWQAPEIAGNASNKSNPQAWYPIGPLSVGTNLYSLGVVVVPSLSTAQNFRITYLPALTPIATSPTDVGMDTSLLPYEWIMWEIGCAIGVRDDDSQLLSYRDQRRQEEKKAAILTAKTNTGTGDRVRGPLVSRGLLWGDL